MFSDESSKGPLARLWSKKIGGKQSPEKLDEYILSELEEIQSKIEETRKKLDNMSKKLDDMESPAEKRRRMILERVQSTRLQRKEARRREMQRRKERGTE